MTIKERYQQVIAYFQKNMPVAETELHYTTSYELIVAVILSAQCTDKRVNMITPHLFNRFPKVEDLAAGEAEDVYSIIKSCSYPNNKSKHLIGMARKVVDEFNGNIPDTVDELQKLPGVGRKTANVIASVIYDLPTMPVDTHVFRVAARLGLSKNAKTPLETEKQLVKYFPEELLPIAHHWLILHGRYVCIARKPRCFECGLMEICLYEPKNLVKS
ncbi:MAG: endonuclease III [Bacteroidetes bacterium]|nr:endonuclease III [Bacteroidota bacterium]